MKNFSWKPVETIEIVHAALIWITLFAAEGVASFILLQTTSAVSYFIVAIVLTLVFCLAIPLLGKKQLVFDIQELCLYDFFVQVIGLTLYLMGFSSVIYLTLAQLIFVLKLVRLVWPIYSRVKSLPTEWPSFGIIAIFHHGNKNRANFQLNKSQVVKLVFLGLLVLAVSFLMQKMLSQKPIPVAALGTLFIMFLGTNSLIRYLESREDAHNGIQHALGHAEGEAAAYAKSVAELTAKNSEIERQAAELAVKHAQLEQQALELTAKNRQLEALSAERAAMMQELAERNTSLRDANHDYKVPLLELTSLVDQAQELATNAVQSKFLNRLDLGLEELRYVMGDIIEQAKVSTELTTPQMQRLEAQDLADFFHERFHRKAEKRGVSFEILEIEEDFAVFTNEMLLRRVITNLANNAILYAKPGRQVTLSFRRSPSRCYVRVFDTGPGIQDANGADRAANFNALIDRIKQQRQPISPYIEESQGHGLGLQIVQRLCRELGTHVELKSKPGLGTVFRFSLPLAD